MEEKLSIQDEISVDYSQLTPSSLGFLLKDELSIDDIRQYQANILQSLKGINSSTDCKGYSCKMTDIVLKEMVIIHSLIDWLNILEKEQGLL